MEGGEHLRTVYLNAWVAPALLSLKLPVKQITSSKFREYFENGPRKCHRLGALSVVPITDFELQMMYVLMSQAVLSDHEDI